MHLVVDRRRREQDAGHPSDAEVEDEGKEPEHRRCEMYAAAEFREEPVEDFHAGRDGDQHRHECRKRR